MDKILILMAIDNSANVLSGETMNSLNGVCRASIYRECKNAFVRIVRKLWRDLNIPGYQIWFDRWWKNIDAYDAVIAVAYQSTYRLFKIMRRKHPHIRRILYWWDPAEKVIGPDKVNGSICEKWTFCKRDAIKYNLRLNTSFFPVNVNNMEHSDECNGIMFVGSIGGGKTLYRNRADILSRLFSFCEKKRIRTSFHLLYMDKSKKKRPFEMENIMVEKDYYNLILQSRAILDIVEPAHEWMTLRPLEALYFHKKLISNNLSLMEEPLYHPDNVFLLGKDPLEQLSDFLNKALYKHDAWVYEHYTFEAWLKRFGLLERECVS